MWTNRQGRTDMKKHSKLSSSEGQGACSIQYVLVIAAIIIIIIIVISYYYYYYVLLSQVFFLPWYFCS
jgi:hypothetical protein